MTESLFYYERIHPTTWVYLSSLLIVGLYFKFSRFWSVRNVDLVLLILLAPGLLMVHYGQQQQRESERLISSRQASLSAFEGGGDSTRAVVTGIDFAGRFESFFTSQLSDGASDQPPAVGDQPTGVGDQRSAIGGQLMDGSAGDVDRGDGARPRVGTAASDGDPVNGDAAATPDRRLTDGQTVEWWGFVWLLCVGGIWLARLLLDPTMERRPLLEPNLAVGGMAFLGFSLFVFLMANVIVSQPEREDLEGPQSAARLLAGRAVGDEAKRSEAFGPGLSLIFMLPSIPTMTLGDFSDDGSGEKSSEAEQRNTTYVVMAKTMAIVSHLAIVVGMVLIGVRHFDNSKMGVGAAALNLLLPYTAQMAGRVNHALPAALLVWAVLCYRRPLVAGIFLGLATGIVYYPLFLLPLWISFYWQRGLARFLIGVTAMLSLVAISLLFVSPTSQAYWAEVQRMFGLRTPGMEGLGGVWAVWNGVFRLPVLAGCVALSASLAIWPPQKNLGTLLSCSAAVMVAVQFWHRNEGGLYMAWYLPLLLLTVFRPNLEDRVALTVLGEARFPRGRWRGLALHRRAAL